MTVVRAWGAYFPTNGKLYVLGGRQTDNAGSDLLNPREYDRATDAWTTKTASFADNQVNNMVGGVVDVGGTDHIVLVGGSAAGAATATAEVRLYDPVADSMTTVTTDPWPGNPGGTVLPGGGAVFDNKLYVFGGFEINVGMVNSIWEFDPNASPGARWQQMTATLPTPVGYIPTATSGSYVYLFGGSTWTGSTIEDSNFSLRYDPVLDMASTVATIPRVVAETRAVTQTDDTVWVLSGGRTNPPNPSTQIDVYDPGTDTWSLAPPIPTPRRNFAADLDPMTGDLWAVGGYDTGGLTPLTIHEALSCVVFIDGFESGDTSAWTSTVP